jgi:CO/xanthine dehydrogenase Mo-binding subunit
MKMETTQPGTVGRSIPRLEATAKVTGRAEYAHNLRLPGMLYGKIHRSVVAHARIRHIDTTAAESVEGVHRVVIAEDIRKVIPDPHYGPAFHDQPILAIDKVRHIGEPVAVVLASDPHIAEEAASRIVVDYEELPAVFGEVEAMTSEAIVHEQLRPAGTFADLKHLQGKTNTNVALDYHLRHGDVESAFAAAEQVFDHTFHTPPVMHVPLEPFVSIAEPGDSKLTIHTASQSPSFVRIEIARLLGWPENRVRVKVPYLGGGFGAKLYIKLEALVTALALMTARPVKISLTMEEQFYMITRHATTVRIKSGVAKDGRLTARQCEIWWNSGAYADIGPRVTQKSGFTAPGPYDIDNVQIDSYALYTNLPPAGALRGFGIPQLVWAYESHTDMIARALDMDPLDFRRKNLLKNGRPQATGTIVKNAATDAVLERVAKRINWGEPLGQGEGAVRRGRGIAIGFKASISPTTSVAIVNVYADGSCALHSSTVDMGQGSDTVMAQIAADVLGIPIEKVTVVHPDTDVTPYDMATLGSRSTYHMGNAVRRAAEDAREKLAAMAQEVDLPAETPIADLFKKTYGMQAGNVIGTGSFIPAYTPPNYETGQSENVTPFWMVGATGVEIEVDTATGKVRVTRLVTVADVGTAINPQIVETQLSGAAIMQLGFTLGEGLQFADGQCTNVGLANYRIPGLLDVTGTIENEIVDSAEHGGPFGAKGVGETGTFGVSPAIANAIEDAIGVRLTALPMNAEAVYRALRDRAGSPLPEDEGSA